MPGACLDLHICFLAKALRASSFMYLHAHSIQSIQTLPQDPIHPQELHQGTSLSPDLLKGLGPFGGTRYHDWALGIQSWAWDQQPLGFEPQLHWWRTPHGLGLLSSFLIHQSPEEVIQLVCAWVGILATCWGSGRGTFISWHLLWFCFVNI